MDLIGRVAANGGVMRTDALRSAAGGSRHAIDRAVRAGALVRPSRGWIAVPYADPILFAAAEVGVVVSCVTRAARLGLWDVHDPHHHVAADAARALRRPTSARVHWARPLVPRHPGSLEDGIENVLALVADCQPYEQAIAIWESAFRKELVSPDQLALLPFGPNARRMLADAMPFSDSGLESICYHRLLWLNIPMERQVWILGRRRDLKIGARLIVEIDGGHHVDAQRLADNEHDAQLRLAGYHVIRVGYRQIFDDWPTVQALITGAIARGLHLDRRP
ncbi:endonuclease domain-containing protein [Microbacterium indicum]|uniref:endonuclease domain-containing protein n=1 Tax=Microbacterium indicum TaxID=358100 RepID=UPI00042A40FA|nr:DUF559 domain-containing protein [Microbacterium indicum]